MMRTIVGAVAVCWSDVDSDGMLTEPILAERETDAGICWMQKFISATGQAQEVRSNRRIPLPSHSQLL